MLSTLDHHHSDRAMSFICVLRAFVGAVVNGNADTSSCECHRTSTNLVQSESVKLQRVPCASEIRRYLIDYWTQKETANRFSDDFKSDDKDICADIDTDEAEVITTEQTKTLPDHIKLVVEVVFINFKYFNACNCKQNHM